MPLELSLVTVLILVEALNCDFSFTGQNWKQVVRYSQSSSQSVETQAVGCS